MVLHNKLISLLLLFLSIESVLSYPHIQHSTSDVNAHHDLRSLQKTLPLQRTFDEIYKRKHNLDGKLNLHPSRRDLVASENLHTVDNFQVYYPQKKEKKDDKESKKEVKEKKVQEENLPLILGSIGAGLYSESNASLELFPNALSEYVQSFFTYFKKGYSNFKKRLHHFFDAIDEHLKKNNGIPVLDLGDVMF